MHPRPRSPQPTSIGRSQGVIIPFMTTQPENSIPCSDSRLCLFLRSVPESWDELDPSGLTAIHERLLAQLTVAGLVERRVTLRLRVSGAPGVMEATIVFTGECGLAKAVEFVLADLWPIWRNRSESANEAVRRVHCERLGHEEWRVTEEGVLAREDIAAGREQGVVDFILRRGFFDGQAMGLPDGRSHRRVAVEGHGSLIRIRRVADETPGRATITDWEAGAVAISQALRAYSATSGCEMPASDPTLKLLSVYTNGVSDERIRRAAQVLAGDRLTANEKLERIDGLMPIPPTASADQLGEMLGVSKQAVMKTAWWRSKRRGESQRKTDERFRTHTGRRSQPLDRRRVEPRMASITTNARGNRCIQFANAEGTRKTIRLGDCDRKSAESICRHVESLLSAKQTGEPLKPTTAGWLKEVGPKLREKLAAVGLIDAPQRALLGEFLRTHVLSRPDVKSSTLEVWHQPYRNLVAFFGEDMPLRKITPGDAERFAQWLRTQNLAAATVAKRLSFARTFLHVARKHKLIDENPFVEVKIPTVDVSKRQAFVGRDVIDKLLNVATPTWKTIIALSRFGGLRCPSEVLSLEWKHVDWKAGRVTVPSPKTDRYDGKGSRVIPLFADLRPYLEDARGLVEPGQLYVVGGKTGDMYRAAAKTKAGQWMNANLRTSFMRLILKAKVDEWPRLFHNLRASRETELLEEFPVHVVAMWMGHDPKVALKHYAQTTDEHFERAAKSAAPGLQKATQQAAAGRSGVSQPEATTSDGIGSYATGCDSMRLNDQASSGAGGI